MDPRELLQALRRYWILFGAVLLAVFGATAIATALTPPMYTAVSEVYVSTSSASSAQDLSQGTTFTQEIVKSYADVATTEIVLNKIRTLLNVDVTNADLARMIQAQAPTDTAVLQLSVTSGSPTTAVEVANAAASALSSAALQLSPVVSNAGGAVTLTTIQHAVTPESPSSPRWGLNLGLGLLTGATIAIALVLGLVKFDTRVRSLVDLRRLTDKPIVGSVFYDQSLQDSSMTASSATGQAAETFRTIRANLQFIQASAGGGTFVVTSSIASEGKSTVSVNIAVALARAGSAVVLVDADLRRPSVASYLGIDGEVGFTDVLIGRVAISQAVQEWGEFGLKVLPSGALPPNPSELMQAPRTASVVAELASHYDYVILDAPPLLPVADAAILATRAQGAIIVCAIRKLRRGQLSSALANLSLSGATVLGLVANMLPARSSGHYGYEYGYGYGSNLARSAQNVSEDFSRTRDETRPRDEPSQSRKVPDSHDWPTPVAAEADVS